MGLTLLASLYKPLAILALIGALVSYRMLLIHQRDSARAEVVTMRAQLSGFEQANAAMKQAVSQQNAAVAKLTEEAAQAEHQAQATLATATQQGAAAMQRQTAQARALTQAAIPGGCASAIAWGNAQGPELGRW